MQATGELGDLGFGIKKLTKKLRKIVPKPVRKIAKVGARFTPAALLFKPTRKGLRKMVPKPLRKVASVVARVSPTALIFKPQRKKLTKTFKSPKAAKIAAIAAGTAAAAGTAVVLSQPERAEAVSALVEQGMAPYAAQRAVEQVTSGGGGGGGGLVPEEAPPPEAPPPEAPEAEEPQVAQAGMATGLPILLIGGAVAYLAYTFTTKKRR